MIKQSWNIGEEERKRILNLHENATKNLYLIKEQQEKSWKLCSYVIFESDGKYYVRMNDKITVEVPKLSELAGTIDNGDLVVTDATQDGVYLGEDFDKIPTCRGERPANTFGAKELIVYFDDLELGIPIFGVIGYRGKMQTDAANFMGEKIQKDKDGVVVQYRKSRSKSFVIEVSPLIVGSPVVEKETPITPTPPQEETLSLNVDSPFNFDNITLTNEAEKQFQSFVEKVKEIYKGVGGNVEVITSSSIDGDPEQTITGAYPDCKNSGTRKQYDFCLSKKRAESIAERLKSSLPETKFNFIAKPIGETDQFAPGMKWPEVKDNSQTAPNRRLIIKLPKITRTTNIVSN